ncbi:MAG: cation:proton antiporter subunit C [Thermodesulfovibrio sp.]|jgi:multicomponent Na+:H+ antiporter subunit C|uniref:cation:proton antiporter subunit C n=1 Tax=unclassified Thermodesulfovibrio TaxID=2645936 RepID=UPI00083A7150|nr:MULTISPECIES: cation:proton antiporter subunit C [unclassified Thermodesulfovibrio]MDI1472253.1 cation:proton antiporter subunit C [Thermodesulfovibrio sp. 1176]MDI6714115.1 cation:proton antiporter subunit C [Thermodesulfovibrio sp.]ODA44631.1 sodium- potassium/hydrogen antiporter subunit C [Thermodesulfovibrio sp. N1]
MEIIIGKYNYWIYIALMMIGFYAMIAKRNLVKKIVGMNIFQTAIILYFISTAYKKNATIPILIKSQEVIDVTQYVNPLPHVLMLTAIVVMVSTFGVALAVIVMLYKKYKTLEEDEIIEILREKK